MSSKCYKDISGVLNPKGKVQVGIRFEEALFGQIKDKAQAEDKSFNSVVTKLCNNALNSEAAKVPSQNGQND